MRTKTKALLVASIAVLSLGLAPSTAVAATAPDCLTVPGKAGAAVDVNIARYPAERPDAWRTVAGKREPVFLVAPGDVLHIPTRITNSGTCHYWTFRGDFTALGYDAFATPGSSTYVEGIGNRTWGASIGVPMWDPNPDRNHPYTRRSEQLNVQVYPGDTAKRLWPLTVDSLPRDGVAYAISIQYDGSVSDPPVTDTARSARIWLIRE